MKKFVPVAYLLGALAVGSVTSPLVLTHAAEKTTSESETVNS